MSEIKQVSSKVVYQNRWMSVREDEVLRPSGAKGIYGVVDKPDFAVIVPVQHGFVYLVEQYRYPVQKRYMEFPQGSLEEHSHTDLLQVAARELREETGLIANKMTYVGQQYLAYGFSSQAYNIYFATDLIQNSTNPDPEEEGLLTRKVSVQEFEKMLSEGVIKDATTTCAYGLVKLKGLL